MKYPNTLILSVLLTGLFAVSALAQQGRPGRGMFDRPGQGMGWNQQWNNTDRPYARIPNLTDEQREQIQQLHLDVREQNLELRNELNEKQARLRTVTTGSTTDMDAANQLIDDMSTLRADMMKQRLQTHSQVRELLTDEQKVVFDSLRPFNRGNNRGMRSGRGPGGCMMGW